MKAILPIILAITACITMQVQAASSFDVQRFNRVSTDSMNALQRKDYERAYVLLDESAKLGDKISQFSLALLYIEGLGVEQDIAQGYVWLNVAAEVNEKRWRSARDQIKEGLTQEQKAALQPMIDEYIEKYGKEAQEVSCYKRKATGSNRKLMQCSKYKTPGQ